MTDSNDIEKLLKNTAYSIFAIGLLGGILLGKNYEDYYYEFSWALAIGTWVSAGISGVFFLGMAEIVRLLQVNVNNMDRTGKSVDVDELPDL